MLLHALLGREPKAALRVELGVKPAAGSEEEPAVRGALRGFRAEPRARRNAWEP